MSWKENFKKLSEVSEVIAGQSPQGKYYNKEGNGLPFYQGKKEFTNKVLGEPTTWTTKTTKEAYEGDILMSVRAPVGPINLCDQTICIGRGLAAIRASDRVNNDYLYYFLLKIEAELIGNTGAVFNSINKTQISNIQIPIPPLQEQQEIVSILDEAFEAIDQAIANIDKNIDNAQELFQSKLNEIFSQRGEGWEEMPIEEVSKVVNGYSFKSNDFSPGNEIKSIKITNVGIMEFVEDLSNNLPLSFLKEYSRVMINEGDLVLALTRSIIKGGLKVAKVPNSYDNSLLNQRVAAIVPNTKVIDSNYLYYYFSSDIVYNYVLDHVNTLMQPNLSISDLKNMPVPITSIEKQRAISSQIEYLSEQINSYRDQLNIKLDNLEELKKSILQKAFAGELTNKAVEDLQLAAEPGERY